MSLIIINIVIVDSLGLNNHVVIALIWTPVNFYIYYYYIFIVPFIVPSYTG